MTIAEQVLKALKNITNIEMLEPMVKYDMCLAMLNETRANVVRKDNLATYTFEDDSVLTEFYENSYRESISWSVNDYTEYEYLFLDI